VKISGAVVAVAAVWAQGFVTFMSAASL